MKKTMLMLALPLAMSVAYAQQGQDMTPKTRAEVKAERDANGGAIGTKVTEPIRLGPAEGGTTSKTTAQVKAERNAAGGAAELNKQDIVRTPGASTAATSTAPNPGRTIESENATGKNVARTRAAVKGELAASGGAAEMNKTNDVVTPSSSKTATPSARAGDEQYAEESMKKNKKHKKSKKNMNADTAAR